MKPNQLGNQEQSHYDMANRLMDMADAILGNRHSSPEAKAYAYRLQDDAYEHNRKARLFGDTFHRVS